MACCLSHRPWLLADHMQRHSEQVSVTTDGGNKITTDRDTKNCLISCTSPKEIMLYIKIIKALRIYLQP